eukprot:765139_1
MSAFLFFIHLFHACTWISCAVASTSTSQTCCNCTVATPNITCPADSLCTTLICNVDSYCCRSRWDSVCAGDAHDICVGNTSLIVQDPDCEPLTVSLPEPVQRHQSAYIASTNSLYIFGGYNATYKWDISNDIWELLGATPTQTFYSPVNAAVTIGNLIYFVAIRDSTTLQNRVYLFDTNTDTWLDNSNIADVPYGGYYSCVAHNHTHLFVVGGIDPSNRKGGDKLKIYDIARNLWTTVSLAPFSNKDYNSQQCWVTNNILYVFGGSITSSQGTTQTNAIYKYSHAIAWTLIGSLPEAIEDGRAIQHPSQPDYIWIVGGNPDTGASLKTIYQFDVNTETVTSTVYHMSSYIAEMSVEFVNNDLLVLGGDDYWYGYSDKILICHDLVNISVPSSTTSTAAPTTLSTTTASSTPQPTSTSTSTATTASSTSSTSADTSTTSTVATTTSSETTIASQMPTAINTMDTTSTSLVTDASSAETTMRNTADTNDMNRNDIAQTDQMDYIHTVIASASGCFLIMVCSAWIVYRRRKRKLKEDMIANEIFTTEIFAKTGNTLTTGVDTITAMPDSPRSGISNDTTPDEVHDTTDGEVPVMRRKSTEYNAELVRWLVSIIGLPQYLETFLENGYDNLLMVELIDDKEQLCAMGVTKEEDQQLIMNEIQKLRMKNNVPVVIQYKDGDRPPARTVYETPGMDATSYTKPQSNTQNPTSFTYGNDESLYDTLQNDVILCTPGGDE